MSMILAVLHSLFDYSTQLLVLQAYLGIRNSTPRKSMELLLLDRDCYKNCTTYARNAANRKVNCQTLSRIPPCAICCTYK